MGEGCPLTSSGTGTARDQTEQCQEEQAPPRSQSAASLPGLVGGYATPCSILLRIAPLSPQTCAFGY
jgi:hypothetical protein